MSTAQLATRYAVSTRMIQRWAELGKLTPVKIGKRGVRFRVIESDRAILAGI